MTTSQDRSLQTYFSQVVIVPHRPSGKRAFFEETAYDEKTYSGALGQSQSYWREVVSFRNAFEPITSEFSERTFMRTMPRFFSSNDKSETNSDELARESLKRVWLDLEANVSSSRFSSGGAEAKKAKPTKSKARPKTAASKTAKSKTGKESRHR